MKIIIEINGVPNEILGENNVYPISHKNVIERTIFT